MEEHLIIENTTVITMDESKNILENATVVIKGDQILEITTAVDIRSKYPRAQYIDGKGKLALPGLINSHTHVAMSLQKGVTLMMDDGLYRVMWPVEKNLTSEDVYIGALAGAAETLKAGSTTVVDHYFFANETANAVTKIGVRGVLGHTIMSYHGPIIGEKEFDAGIAFLNEWHNRHPLVTPWLAPHATDTVSKAWLIKLREIASEKNAGLHLHLAQTQKERQYINEEYGMGCVEYLDDIGVLGPDVIAAHCIFITESEIDLLAESGAHPVYCPMGHSLNARPARAWDMLKKGVSVLIATDCVTSNNVMDLLGELKMAGAAQKTLTGDTTAMPALKILEMVTVDAAEAIGMGDKLGRIKPGYLADIILVDFHNLSTAPNYSYLDNLIYCCNGRDVHTVIVNGDIVVQDHKLITMDEDGLTDEIEARGQMLIKKAIQGDAELENVLTRTH